MDPTVWLRPIDMVSHSINCQHSCNRPDSGVPSTPPGKQIAEPVKRFGFPGPHYPHDRRALSATACVRRHQIRFSHCGRAGIDDSGLGTVEHNRGINWCPGPGRIDIREEVRFFLSYSDSCRLRFGNSTGGPPGMLHSAVSLAICTSVMIVTSTVGRRSGRNSLGLPFAGPLRGGKKPSNVSIPRHPMRTGGCAVL